MDKKITVYIEGLDCEDEAKIIRSKMEGLKGIVSFDINIMARSLNLAFDENMLTEQDIVRVYSDSIHLTVPHPGGVSV